MTSTSFMSTAKANRFSITEAAGEFQVDRATVYAWGRTGILGRNGERVILKLTKIGGRFAVFETDMERFIAALNDPSALATTVATDSADNHAQEADELGL